MPLSALAWQPPAGAVRDVKLEAWEVCERDAGGVRHGECTLYRDDGTLLLRCRYAAGKRSGAFTSYHPNGELESEGSYVDGMLDGTFVRRTSGKPGSAPLRDCCVPPGARELHVAYARGMSFGETFFDGAGRALRSDGTPLPERAPGVPSEAVFDEGEERWVLRAGSDHETLVRRSFDLEGRPVEDVEIVRGRRVALREYQRSGALAREIHFDEAGALHGPCTFGYGDDAPYVERAIREVRGQYEHGQSVGTWRFLDADGRELFARDRGEALTDDGLRELLGPERGAGTAESLLERIGELSRERRLREALFVAARAAARAGRAEALKSLLQSAVVPLEEDVAKARATALEREGSPSIAGVFDALFAGGDPAELFRQLALMLSPVRPAALDLVEASLLLEPGNNRALVARALIKLDRGDVAGAFGDARALGPELDDAARQIHELGRILFPKLRFSPSVEPLPEPNPELTPVGVEQSLDAVRRTVALYATRLEAIRAELRRRLDVEPDWLPPDLSHLLPTGPVELRRFTATITDEDESGSETSEVLVDETLELSEAAVASLMIVARADFDALSWLCWSAGLDEIALPTALVPRPHFAAVVNEAMRRCYRAHDQLSTGGLVSQSRGVASFSWEELPVETLTRRFAEICAQQYLERRAMFFWLLFPENLSPFQSDLRKV